MFWQSLTDEQIFAMLRNLSGDFTGDDDNDICDDYASHVYQDNAAKKWFFDEPSGPNAEVGATEAD